MPHRRRSPLMKRLPLAGARMLGWLTDLATIIVMGYIIKCWPGNGGAVSAGLVGAAIALLNDSWEMVAYIDPTGNFIPLSPPRAVLHDLFSMGVCMGGLILLLFSDIREQRSASEADLQNGGHGGWDEKRKLFAIAQWLLAAVAALRFVFAIWSGCNCTGERMDRNRRQRNRAR